MEFLGEHNKRKVYWWNYSGETLNELPLEPWLCFAIVDELPEFDLFERFAKTAIKKNVYEFKVFGNLSSKLDDLFDEIMVIEEVINKSDSIEVMTTWHDKEGFASAFWQSFYATCVPESVNRDTIKIVCCHFQNRNLEKELKIFINRFNDGWIPSENE